MEAIKLLVHTITNHIQGVIGYLEIGEHVKAMKCAREAGKDLRTLSKMLVGYGKQDEQRIATDDTPPPVRGPKMDKVAVMKKPPAEPE